MTCIVDDVIQIATKYSDILSEDPEVHFKYIQAATRTGQLREVEHICRERVVPTTYIIRARQLPARRFVPCLGK